MDLNKYIIDQRIRKIVKDNPSLFTQVNEQQKLSQAFLVLSVATFLEVDIIEAEATVTEGGNDAGIDALYLGDTNNYEFSVFLFQLKYHFNLEKEKNFPANSVLRVVESIKSIFDPSKTLVLNEKIKPKIEEIRSLILDGYIPNIKCIFVSNGLSWQEEGDKHIQNAGFPQNQVSFLHFNHADIVKSFQSTAKINETLSLSGKAVIEDFAFKRVLVGKMNVSEIAELMNRHGDSLLEKNIRKFLGLHKNRVNEAIRGTLLDEEKKYNFYFFNNGITMLCTKFRHSGLQESNWKLHVEDLQIINGGQTSKTIQKTLTDYPEIDFSKVTVLVRLYEVSSQDEDAVALTTDITVATNSQNPVDLRDLRANDSVQNKLKIAIDQLGYSYVTKRGEATNHSVTIPSSVAAEAVFTVWKRKPHLARFRRSELFGKFYEEVFQDLNGAQLILAVLIFRFCDASRKRIVPSGQYQHITYSHYFMAMLIGDAILEYHNITFDKITHLNFKELKSYFEHNQIDIYNAALQKINDALERLMPNYGGNVDLRRLSAMFRRGDLLTEIG